MTEEAGINRRRFLAITLWLGLSAFFQAHRPWVELVARTSHRLLSLRLASVFRHADSARTIGLEYLRSVPAEADAQRLVDLIASGFSNGSHPLDDADAVQLHELLKLRIQKDFEEGQIVKLQGWIMSATEARLCAVAALA